MIINTRQYRPFTNYETYTNNGLQADLYDQAANLNNFMVYVARFPVINQFCIADSGTAASPGWMSHDSTTDERVIWPSARRLIPDGFTIWCVNACHIRTTGSGSTTWRLYCTGYPYRGDAILDTTHLSVDYDSISWTSGASYRIEVSRALSIIGSSRDGGRETYLVLTAQNSDAGTRSMIQTLGVWPNV